MIALVYLACCVAGIKTYQITKPVFVLVGLVQ